MVCTIDVLILFRFNELIIKSCEKLLKLVPHKQSTIKNKIELFFKKSKLKYTYKSSKHSLSKEHVNSFIKTIQQLIQIFLPNFLFAVTQDTPML